jgi:hypothetical protein
MVIFDRRGAMRVRRAVNTFLFIQLIFIHALSAQARGLLVPVPELAPLPLSQQLAALREPLPVETIVDAALEFSGAQDQASATAKDKLADLLVRFREEVADVTLPGDLAERALTFLHRNLLTTYSVLQTRVDTALESGVYNCVSSAVLYMIVARSVGLSVSGVRTADHAFCSVLVNGQQVDVETTNPFGFNPGAKKDFTDSFGKVTGYSYVPPGNYRDRRSIGEKELLSLILYNRVSEYGDSRSFRDALQPAVSAFTLMGNDETRQVMKIAFSNYVTWMGMRQDFAGAIHFTETVKASFGGIVDLDQQRRDIYHNWTVMLLDASALADAESLLAQPVVRAALDDTDWTNLSVALVQRRAQATADVEGLLAASGIIADALKRLGRLPTLLTTYEAYIHNAFAMSYNAHKYADARSVIDQGLGNYPESAMFRQDLELVKKAQR